MNSPTNGNGNNNDNNILTYVSDIPSTLLGIISIVFMYLQLRETRRKRCRKEDSERENN